MSKLKPIPAFKSEAEERKFWETHNSTDYIDWSKAERVRFPNLKPSTTAISIRLPLGLLEQIKIVANKRDVPYQSLIKMWLAEKVGKLRPFYRLLFRFPALICSSNALSETRATSRSASRSEPYDARTPIPAGTSDRSLKRSPVWP